MSNFYKVRSCCEYSHFNCNQGGRRAFRKPKTLTLNRVKVALCLLFIFVAYGVVGTMDYEDELAAQAYAKPTQTAQGGDKQ